MPTYRIQAPNGRTYTIEGPPGASQEEVVAAVLAQDPAAGQPPAPTTVGGQVKEFFKGIPAGAVNMLESAATGASALLPDSMESGARETIKSVAGAAKAPFAPEPGYEGGVASKLGQATGSFVPFLALGPMGAAGRAAAVGLGAGAGAGEARTRAEEAGATEDQRGTATLLGAGVGLSEVFAPFRILGRVPELAKASGIQMVRRALQAGGEEAAQEAAANWAQNLIAQQIYKPEQELIEGLGESAAYGGAVGALAQGVLDLALGRRARASAAAQEEEQQRAAAAAEQQRREQGFLDAEREAPSAVMPETGARQGSLPGLEGTPDVEETPAEPVDPVQRAGFLRAQIPQIDARMDEIRQANLAGATLAEREARERQMEQLRQARAQAEQELAALNLPDAGTQAKALTKLQKQLQAADEAGDTTKALELARRIEEMGGDQGTLDLGPTRQINFARNDRANREMLARQMAEGRETAAQRRTQIEQEIAALRQMGQGDPNDPTSAARMRQALQRQRELERELAEIEAQAAGTGLTTEQPRLFGEPEGVDRVGTAPVSIEETPGVRDALSRVEQELVEVRGDMSRIRGRFSDDLPTPAKRVLADLFKQAQEREAALLERAGQLRRGLSTEAKVSARARSEAQVLTDLDIAKATRNRQAVEELVQELRALRESARTRERETRTAQTDVSQLQDRELERASGMQMPAQTAQRQALTDARYRAFGQMVSTLDRFNRGRADADALKTAERQVADTLVAEIGSLRGSALTPAERSMVLLELRPLLEDLKSRFGDTRNVVNMGTRKEPEMEPVQTPQGPFRTDLPGPGAGPTGFGLENQESRRPGDRTFSNRYAAAQSILEGIDQIRNRSAGRQETAPGVDRTDSTRPIEQRLDDALRAAQARATPEQRRLLDQLDENRDAIMRSRGVEEQALPPSRAGRVPQRLAESAIEFGNRVARGQDTTDLERELQDGLRAVAQAQESEAEPLLERRGRALTQREREQLRGTSMEGRTSAMGVEPVANLKEGPLEQRGVARTGQQQEMFEGRGALFDSFKALEEYLASDALSALRKSMGQTRETMSRLMRLAAPLQKRAAELEKQALALLERRAKLVELNVTERAVAESQVADGEAALARAQADMDDDVAKYREAYAQAQEQLQANLNEAAQIQQQIAENAERLEAEIRQDERFRSLKERTKERMRNAFQTLKFHASGAARGKEKMAKLLAKAAPGEDTTGVDPAALVQAHEAIARDQRASIAATNEMIFMSREARVPLPGIPSDTFLNFLIQNTELDAQRRNLAARMGGLTAARNRAQRALDAAQAAAAADPQLSQRLAAAKDIALVARSLRADAERNIAAREREVAALDAQLSRTETQARDLREMSDLTEEKRRRTLRVPDARETIGEREARDGKRRAAEQQTLQTRQEGPGTERERVSFEPRRQQQAALEEAPERIAQLEEMVSQRAATPEQQAQVDAALQELRDRQAALQKKVEGQNARLAGALNAQGKTLEAIAKAREAYAAAEPDSPQRARAQQRLVKLLEQMNKRAAYISRVQGIERTRVPTRAEQRTAGQERLDTAAVQAAADRRAQARKEGTRPDAPTTPEERVAEIAEGQTTRRAGSRAMREVRQGGGFRTGNVETVEQRKGTQRTRIVESTKPTERDTPISKKEQKAANKAAKEIQKARAEAERILPPSRVASAVEDTDPLDMYDDSAALREDNTYYESNRQTPVSDKAEDALEAGDVDGFLAEIEVNGSTPFHRSLAAALRPYLRGAKVEVVDNLVFKGQRALGVYQIRTNTIQLDAFGGINEETALHEMVHAATLRALRNLVRLDPEQQQALADLQNLYQRVKDDPLFKREYANKNLEEFIAELMTNPQVRDKINRIAAGQSSLLQRIYSAILRFLGVPRQYSTATGEKAIMDVVRIFEPSQATADAGPAVASVMRGVFPATKPEYAGVPPEMQKMADRIVGRNPTLVDRVMANVSGLAFRTQFLDRFAPVDALLEKGVAKGMISDAQALQTSYFLRFGEQRNQFVEQAATTAVPQLMKNADGDHVIQAPDGKRANIARIAQALGKAGTGNEQATERLFTTYLAVKRGEQVGFDKLNYDGAVTPADAAQINAYVNGNPQVKAAFEEARALYREYNNDLLDLMVQTGSMTKDKAAALKKGDYVPYYRQDANGVVNLIVAGEQPIRIGNIKDQPYLQELVGGNEKILPFFTGAMQNTSMLIDMALRNKQVMEVAALINNLGLAKIRQGAGPRGRNVLQYTINGDPVHMVLDEAVDAFGVPADLLVKGLEGIKTTLPAGLRLLQYPTNILRTFITRSPAYAVRQLVREPINAWLVSGASFTPVLSSVKALHGVLMKTDPATNALERGGAISSNVFTGDMQDQARILRDVQRGKTPWQAVMTAADKMAVASDTATRAVLYDKYRKQGMTHMQALMGTLETMNFSRRGLSPTMQMMSMLVPFFNAQVQGIDVIYRSLRGKSPMEKRLDVQKKLFTRGLGITAATLAYAALMSDDEAYKNATPEQRALNWFLPLPGFEEPLRVPIPFELGYLFKALPELAFNTAFSDTKAGDAAATIGRLAWQTVPIGIPQALKPALEVATNYSFFTDSPVESARERGMQPEARMRDNTTELAKMLGGAGGLSPVQIDYLIRGYTGGLGLTLLGLASSPMKLLAPADVPELPEKKTSQMPFIGALFQPVDGRAAIDGAYEDIQSWQQAHNTFQALVAQGKRSEALQFAQKFGNQLALNSTGGAFRQQMGELATLRRAVIARTDLTPQEKRAQVDRIRQVEIALARRIRELGARPS